MHGDDRANKDPRGQAKKRMRFTGKTFKSKATETLIKDEPRDSLVTTLQPMDVPLYDSNCVF